MVPAERADVAVIGAGPAGSAAALSSPELVRRALVDRRFRGTRRAATSSAPGSAGARGSGRARGGSGAGGRHARGRPHRAVGPAAVPTRPDLSDHGAALPFRARPDAPHRRSRRRLRRARLAPAHRLDDGRLAGFELSDGTRLHADVVIGADGATRRVATAAGLVGGPGAVGVRAAPTSARPSTCRRSCCGTRPAGAASPATAGSSPGPGAGQPRRRGRRARRPGWPAMQPGRWVPSSVCSTDSGCSIEPPAAPHALGGWLKMGMVGTVPARVACCWSGAAGLRQPAPGRGDLRGPGQRAGSRRGRPRMPGRSGHRLPLVPGAAPPPASNAAIQAALVRRATVVAATGRLLTAPVVSMPSPAAGPSTGTSCSTALPREPEHNRASHPRSHGQPPAQPNPLALRHERPHQWHVNELRAGSAPSAVGR